MSPERILLRHTLAALAYRTQKALGGYPSGFGDLRGGVNVRTLDMAGASPTDAQFLQGRLSVAMTHAWQLAILRRLAGSPVPWGSEPPAGSLLVRVCIVSMLFAFALLSACDRDSSGERVSAVAATSDTGRVNIEGGSLFYKAAGAGGAIVFIHGGNLDHRMWDAQFVLLKRTHRVIAYDARGFGRSSATDRSFRAPDDLAALLRAHGIAKATLVGLSMGGGIAIDFALAYPDMVHRLVLASPSISGGTWAPDADTLWLRAGRAAFARGDSVGLALAWLESDYIRTALHPPEQADRLKTMLVDNAGHLMRRARNQNIEWEISSPAAGRLTELRVPILLLVGSADTPLILSMAQAIAQQARQVERVDFAGIGHMINLEAAAEFNHALSTFLARR